MNFSAPYATGDIHNSAPHLQNGYIRISGDLVGAYDTYPKQLQSFGNTSVPKEIKTTRGQSNPGSYDWTEKLVANFNDFYALHQELVERPHDLATIQAYEAYKKRSEERKIKFSPSQIQSFGNTSLPKETSIIGGKSCPAEDNADNTTTFDDLSVEHRQVFEEFRRKRNEEFEAIKKKRMEKHEEEFLQEFLANLKKDREENITPAEEIKLPLSCSNQFETSAKLILEEDEVSEIERFNHDLIIDLVSTVTSVIETAESNSICAESIMSKEIGFIDQEHGKLSKIVVLDFSDRKSVV